MSPLDELFWRDEILQAMFWLRGEGLAERVTQIKTKFWIGEDEQNDLFTAAKLLMKRVDEKKLLSEESMNMSCAVATAEKK